MAWTQKGPTVWHGLPDLRDHSPDSNSVWNKLPVRTPQITEMLQINRPQIYLMMNSGIVDVVDMFGYRQILLGSLPQTARCRYIEMLFRPGEPSKNILHKSTTVCTALELSRRALANYARRGNCEKEILPTGTIRYPEWGFEEPQRLAIREYYESEK